MFTSVRIYLPTVQYHHRRFARLHFDEN